MNHARALRGLSVSAISLAALCTVIAVDQADAKTALQVEIPVNFVGLEVARLTQTVTVDGKNYALSGRAKATKLATIVSSSRADWQSSGRIAGNRVVPNAHGYSYKSRKKRGSLAMSFSGGNIAKVSSVPPVKYKPDSVPVLPAHLKAVLDPVSALVVPVSNGAAASGKQVCNRTLQLFDGKARVDLVLRHKSSRRRVATGFDGMTHTCSVRYRPVSGIRPATRTIKAMKKNAGIEITLAQVGNTDVYSLFGFNVPTSRGTAKGVAKVFAAN